MAGIAAVIRGRGVGACCGRFATFNHRTASRRRSYRGSSAYNARGQTTGIAYGNGVYANYTYNDARGFLTRAYALNGPTTLFDTYYSRNAKGMITNISTYTAGIADAGRTWIYGYDGLDRLISADNQNGVADDRWYMYIMSKDFSN